ncbi:MAG TPA: hypothetical protein VKB79_15140 [Bryobacteraceae bacterium]|nr:hypothetical protein [Bryobacteraceae bacterium]
MAHSRKPNPIGLDLRHERDRLACPARTPGSLGINDAGDPSRFSLLGDTPGPLGNNDHACPDPFVLPGLNTFHEWALESRVHVEPDFQVGHYYPAGKKSEVLLLVERFLVKVEGCPGKPYLPQGGKSGITIGIGYDLGQHWEKEFRGDWAELDPYLPANASLGVDLTLPEPSVPGLTLPATPTQMNSVGRLPRLAFPDPKLLRPPSVLDRLAKATRGRLPRSQLSAYLRTLQDVNIPRELAMEIHGRIVAKEYDEAVKTYPGFDELPAGVQVALLSMIFNRGPGNSRPAKVAEDRMEMRAPYIPDTASLGIGRTLTKPAVSGLALPSGQMNSLGRLPRLTFPESRTAAPAPAKLSADDVFDSRWEMSELGWAIQSKDLVWIYWMIESMRRVWANAPGLQRRRNEELKLIYPYVAHDLRVEALRQRFGSGLGQL